MKVMITIMQGVGNLNPVVPLARELQAAGHEIVFACAPSFVSVVEAMGFSALPAGFDWQQLPAESRSAKFDWQQMPQTDRLPSGFDWQWQQQTAHSQQEQPAEQWAGKPSTQDTATHGQESDSAPPMGLPVLAGQYVEKVFPDLLALVKQWQPDVIVHGSMDFAAYLVADANNIPHATASNSLIMPKWMLRMMVGEPLSAARARYGLPPDRDLAGLDHYLYLCMTPPDYQYPDTDVPTLHFVRPTTEDNVYRQDQLPVWLDSLPDRPTIYITMGTTFNRTPALFTTILEGLRYEALNLVVTVGKTQDPQRFGPQPPNVYIERYIPMTLLLPRCDVVICHGGANTVMTTLSYGLPIFVTPVAADQPFHAQRCFDLGLGLTLLAADLKPDDVRSSVRRLLDEEHFRLAAQRVQREIEAMPGPEYAVELLVRLAKERRPILSRET